MGRISFPLILIFFFLLENTQNSWSNEKASVSYLYTDTLIDTSIRPASSQYYEISYMCLISKDCQHFTTHSFSLLFWLKRRLRKCWKLTQIQVKAFKIHIQDDHALTKTTWWLLHSHASLMFLTFTLSEISKEKDGTFSLSAGLAQVVFAMSGKAKTLYFSSWTSQS